MVCRRQALLSRLPGAACLKEKRIKPKHSLHCLFSENTSEAGHATPRGAKEHEKDSGEFAE